MSTPPNPKAFACRNCGGQVEVRAPGQTLMAVWGVLTLKVSSFFRGWKR